MRKGLLRTVLLMVALIAILTVVFTMRSSFRAGTLSAGEGQTLFEQFVIGGGPIVWFVLLPMSLITVFLAVEHGLTIRRKKLLPSGAGPKTIQIIQQFGPEKLSARIGADNDFVSVAIVRAVSRGKGDWFRMRSIIAESLQEQAWGLFRRIEWLNLIGNVSPMVGLFGTVFGMIRLFNAIVTAGGQPQPAHLADGISVALVTTFWGLFIAIPALAIHGVFRNRIETLVSDAVTETENIVPEIRRALRARKQAEQPKQEVSSVKPRIQELPAKPKGTVDQTLPSS